MGDSGRGLLILDVPRIFRFVVSDFSDSASASLGFRIHACSFSAPAAVGVVCNCSLPVSQPFMVWSSGFQVWCSRLWMCVFSKIGGISFKDWGHHKSHSQYSVIRRSVCSGHVEQKPCKATGPPEKPHPQVC